MVQTKIATLIAVLERLSGSLDRVCRVAEAVEREVDGTGAGRGESRSADGRTGKD